MLKKSVFMAFSALLALGQPVHANDRYQSRPPVMVSPDLSAPWVTQLHGNSRRVVTYPTRQQMVPRQQAMPQVRRMPVEAGTQRRRTLLGGESRMPVQRASMPRQAPVRTQIDPMFLPQTVAYQTKEKPGTIVIDTNNRFLYLVQPNGTARRYGVGVGKPGFDWAGTHKVTRKAEWPNWTPPKEMIAREAAKGHYLPAHMEGGPENPLGARALYLGSTLYRIHGTNAPWTIGSGVSSGCIRMRNEDVTDLYERVRVGTRVIVI